MFFTKHTQQVLIFTMASCMTMLDTSRLFGYATQTIQQPIDFTQTAKVAIPAVVSIQVQEANKNTSAKGSRSVDSWGEDAEQNSGSIEDFFQRYFSLPHND